MGFVDGWSPMETGRRWPEPFHSDLVARQGLAYQLVEGIALLGSVDWRAKGLDELGRPDGFHDRQVDRWTAFLERIKGRELPGFDVAAGWLRAAPSDRLRPRPDARRLPVRQCDVQRRCPGSARRHRRLGDGHGGRPKLDLGWVVQSWPEDMKDPSLSGAGYADLYGMPTRDELVQHYATVSGRQVDDLDYYIILAKWKLGVVLEQGYQRAAPDDEKLQAFGPIVLDLMKGAAELAETTDYRQLSPGAPPARSERAGGSVSRPMEALRGGIMRSRASSASGGGE